MVKKRVGLLHGAGYAGGELIRLIATHPHVDLAFVTSRTFAGQPIWEVHSALRGQLDLVFSAPDSVDCADCDAILLSAEHGQAAALVRQILDTGFDGPIVDLSADFRFDQPFQYDEWFDFTHPAPELLSDFVYGLPEVKAPYGEVKYIANPGCFASGLSLALFPLTNLLRPLHASVTALTGASGSGTRPKATTHYPTREGNVRAYKVLAHQHLPEVQNVVGPDARIAFVPVSGPWTRGIWGTAHIQLPPGIGAEHIQHAFDHHYADKRFVRLFGDRLPELKPVVGTPFCDIGWTIAEGHLVVGFAWTICSRVRPARPCKT